MACVGDRLAFRCRKLAEHRNCDRAAGRRRGFTPTRARHGGDGAESIPFTRNSASALSSPHRSAACGKWNARTDLRVHRSNSPVGYPVDQYVMHPGLIDAALQLCLVAIGGGAPVGSSHSLHLPLGADRIQSILLSKPRSAGARSKGCRRGQTRRGCLGRDTGRRAGDDCRGDAICPRRIRHTPTGPVCGKSLPRRLGADFQFAGTGRRRYSNVAHICRRGWRRDRPERKTSGSPVGAWFLRRPEIVTVGSLRMNS